mmetsp:Transcript_34632/g.48233  ORF Transcript_34632/g.48233 Transcript_34632/m.48233 type:complete len:97 (-) Transcript_34632:393-683(-)
MEDVISVIQFEVFNTCTTKDQERKEEDHDDCGVRPPSPAAISHLATSTTERPAFSKALSSIFISTVNRKYFPIHFLLLLIITIITIFTLINNMAHK